jgi:biotin transporter BioY
MTGVGWTNSFCIGALPFLPGEVIKMALIVAAVGGLEFARQKNHTDDPCSVVDETSRSI